MTARRFEAISKEAAINLSGNERIDTAASDVFHFIGFWRGGTRPWKQTAEELASLLDDLVTVNPELADVLRQTWTDGTTTWWGSPPLHAAANEVREKARKQAEAAHMAAARFEQEHVVAVVKGVKL